MGFIADILYRKSVLDSLKAENDGLKEEVERIKNDLERMTIKCQLAEELAQDALKMNQMLLRQPDKPTT
jgi:hypothetical protein